MDETAQAGKARPSMSQRFLSRKSCGPADTRRRGLRAVRRVLGPALAAAISAGPLAAHEVWIDADRWQVEPSDRIVADLRNGEIFEGIDLAWLPPRIVRAEIRSGGETRDIAGRAGDIPAFDIGTDDPGLVVLGYQGAPSALTYDSYEKFESFALEKGHAALIANAPRMANPRELFARYAKALVAVGAGAGQDEVFGFEVELVAETNPYTAPDKPMVLRLIYQNAALADARVTVFERPAKGDVETEVLTTDAEGRVTFDTTPGSTYLVDSVVLRRPAGELVLRYRVIWESLWASLTFAVPDDQ